MEEILSFGHWLKLRRQALRLTQGMLAGRVYCSSELIRKIEADARRPSRRVAERLAEHLGLAPQQRATFVKVARGELRVAQLPAPMQVPAWPEPDAPVIQRRWLPAPATPLIGRATELAELGALLQNPACRLITIVGSGGIGKTRLALAAATEQATAFAHGAALVPLADLSSATFLAPTMLTALDVAPQGQRDPREQLLAYLRGQELLLVLDNFEQLLTAKLTENAGGIALLTELIQGAPGVTLLITSRERLAVHGEWLFDLSGLSYPLSEPTEGFDAYPAVQLFLQSARQVRRQFALAEGEAAVVARICRLVEGLPLAIELAAAALRSRSCIAIAAAITMSLAGLATEQRAIPERHRSMWATFEHSWRLLSAPERQVFPRLSVFRGGFEEDAAAQVAQASPQHLAALVDKSLLRWDGVARYDLHELVRQYASEKLRESDEEAQICNHHLTYFLKLAEQVDGPRSATWLRRLNHDLNNIRAALEWSEQHDSLAGLQLASALKHYWARHSPLQEGIGCLERLLHHPSTAAYTATRAKALTALSVLNGLQNENAAARQQAEKGLGIYRGLGDQHGVASALLVLGGALCLGEGYAAARPHWFESLTIYRKLGDTFGIIEALGMLGQWESNHDAAQARMYLEEGLALCRELGDIMATSMLLENLGVLALRQGDYAAAQACLTEALVQQRSLGVTSAVSVIGNLGVLRLWQGEYEQARADFEACVALCRESGQTMHGLWAFVRLGYIALRQGDLERASALLSEGLQRFNDIGNTIGVVYTLEGLASLAVAQDRPMHAVRVFAWADAMRRTIANARPSVEQADVERDFGSIRTQLDEAIIEAARAEGRTMTLEQVIACALEGSAVEADQPVQLIATAKQSG